jgi:channel protein (hemolysin III family)
LVVAAGGRGDAARLVGCGVFAASLIARYTASTIYHSLPVSRAKDILRRLDHAAIYRLIADTYTPFTSGFSAAPGPRLQLRGAPNAAGRVRRRGASRRRLNAPIFQW